MSENDDHNTALIHTYIASLGHSGSTILGIALGSVDGGVSIGELDATVRRIDAPQHDCTCGADVDECPVWGPVFAEASLHEEGVSRSEIYERIYRALYRSLRTSFPPPVPGVSSPRARIIVDTSKDPLALKSIPTEPAVDLKVVFLVKDPRSYFVSHYRKWLAGRESVRENRGKRVKKRRAPVFALELCVAVLNWWWGNRRILRILRSGGYEFLPVCYEELVLDTGRTEERVSEFLGVPVTLQEIPVRPGQRHILRGNALRHSPDRSSRLRYDYRWFYDPWVRRLGFAFRPLIKWGQRRGILPYPAPPTRTPRR